MDDILSRAAQVQSVADGFYDEYSDAELTELEENAFQSRNWMELEFIYAEFEFRNWNKLSGITRDAWVRKELEQLDKRP